MVLLCIGAIFLVIFRDRKIGKWSVISVMITPDSSLLLCIFVMILSIMDLDGGLILVYVLIVVKKEEECNVLQNSFLMVLSLAISIFQSPNNTHLLFFLFIVWRVSSSLFTNSNGFDS